MSYMQNFSSTHERKVFLAKRSDDFFIWEKFLCKCGGMVHLQSAPENWLLFKIYCYWLAIFWRPNTAHCQKRQNIKKILYEKTQFSEERMPILAFFTLFQTCESMERSWPLWSLSSSPRMTLTLSPREGTTGSRSLAGMVTTLKRVVTHWVSYFSKIAGIAMWHRPFKEWYKEAWNFTDEGVSGGEDMRKG